MSLTCPCSGGKSGLGNGFRGHRRVTYQAVPVVSVITLMWMVLLPSHKVLVVPLALTAK